MQPGIARGFAEMDAGEDVAGRCARDASVLQDHTDSSTFSENVHVNWSARSQERPAITLRLGPTQ